MRKVMVGIPVLNGNDWVKKCVDSTYPQADDFLIIDNGADREGKIIIEPYKKIVNEKNIYVNPAWNQIMKAFLESDNNYLIIQNSDLILGASAINEIRKIDIAKDKTNIIAHQVDEFSNNPSEEIIDLGDGVPGIMIIMDKEMCKMVYPIPEDLKLWYGDNWIYCRLQKNGYKFILHKSIEVKHGLSKSINYLPDHEKGPIIDSDKNLWETKYKYLI
jgi:hypothetical protein